MGVLYGRQASRASEQGPPPSLGLAPDSPPLWGKFHQFPEIRAKGIAFGRVALFQGGIALGDVRALLTAVQMRLNLRDKGLTKVALATDAQGLQHPVDAKLADPLSQAFAVGTKESAVLDAVPEHRTDRHQQGSARGKYNKWPQFSPELAGAHDISLSLSKRDLLNRHRDRKQHLHLEESPEGRCHSMPLKSPGKRVRASGG